jgi:hypothetical protein
MKRILVIIAISFLFFTLTVPDAWARGRIQGDLAGCCGSHYYQCCQDEIGCRGSHCYQCRHDGVGCYGEDYQERRAYIPTAFETINGEVIDLYETTSRSGYRSGLHLLLKTNEKTIDVRLGPIWYLEQENFNFEPGDSLEIKGDLVTDSQMPTMIAIEVKKDNQLLTLDVV